MKNKKKEKNPLKTCLLTHENLKTALFAADDGCRPSISGLIVDSENMVSVATNGIFAVISPINETLKPPDWKIILPTKQPAVRIAFRPEFLIKLLQFWEKNVNEQEVVLEFYPEYMKTGPGQLPPMLRATDREKRTVGLLTALRIPED